MENVDGQQGLVLQQFFPYFEDSNHHKISFFNATGASNLAI